MDGNDETLVDRLRRSNRELEEFAATVAHDLKEPLRGIRTLARFLAEDYGERLDQEGRDRLATVERLGGRLEAYVEALFQHARVGQEPLSRRETDVAALLAEVVDTVTATECGEGECEVAVEAPMPTMRCDSVMLALVFSNLIRNGIKYNEAHPKRIRIRYLADAHPGLHTFSVTDNGIGIRADHRAHVFTTFKRLHPRDAYGGGTGMGLTLVQRAVERHDGSVWVEAAQPSGSAFFFTIREPAPQPG